MYIVSSGDGYFVRFDYDISLMDTDPVCATRMEKRQAEEVIERLKELGFVRELVRLRFGRITEAEVLEEQTRRASKMVWLWNTRCNLCGYRSKFFRWRRLARVMAWLHVMTRHSTAYQTISTVDKDTYTRNCVV